jgi:curved DNA-binding protein CbpA
MLAYFLTLSLPLEASDEEIRKRYLELIKKHTPEKDPDQFQKITTAYEKIRSAHLRIRTRLFGVLDHADPEKSLLALSRARKPVKKRTGLDELFAAEKNLSKNTMREHASIS